MVSLGALHLVDEANDIVDGLSAGSLLEVEDVDADFILAEALHAGEELATGRTEDVIVAMPELQKMTMEDEWNLLVELHIGDGAVLLLQLLLGVEEGHAPDVLPSTQVHVGVELAHVSEVSEAAPGVADDGVLLWNMTVAQQVSKHLVPLASDLGLTLAAEVVILIGPRISGDRHGNRKHTATPAVMIEVMAAVVSALGEHQIGVRWREVLDLAAVGTATSTGVLPAGMEDGSLGWLKGPDPVSVEGAKPRSIVVEGLLHDLLIVLYDLEGPGARGIRTTGVEVRVDNLCTAGLHLVEEGERLGQQVGSRPVGEHPAVASPLTGFEGIPVVVDPVDSALVVVLVHEVPQVLPGVDDLVLLDADVPVERLTIEHGVQLLHIDDFAREEICLTKASLGGLTHAEGRRVSLQVDLGVKRSDYKDDKKVG